MARNLPLHKQWKCVMSSGECRLCSKESDVQCSSTFWVYSWSQWLRLQCDFKLI